MAKILIYLKNMDPGEEYDIWNQVEPKFYYETFIKNNNKNVIINYANRLWFQGIVSCIDTNENQLFYYNEIMSFEEINNKFDMIIIPQANLFSERFKKQIIVFCDFIRNIKIPVFFVACGAQARSYNHIDLLVKSIGDCSKRLIDLVYTTGGEFALRGKFTKEFFDLIGTNTAAVTGCPSIFQLGRDLKISNEKCSKNDFVPIFNGNSEKECLRYSNSYFIDQDVFFRFLYNTDFSIDSISKNEIRQLIKAYGYDKIKLLFNNRIKLFVDMNDWYNFLIHRNISFSFGSRIHGNIMPLLAGIPSAIIAEDTRVQELAEYFNIPLYNSKKHIDIYDYYMSVDYTEFNKNFSQRFDVFEKFLCDHSIVKKVNQKNKFFFSKKECFSGNLNEEGLGSFSKEINKVYYKMYYMAFALYREAKKISKA